MIERRYLALAGAEGRTLSGLAVPYGKPAQMPWGTERELMRRGEIVFVIRTASGLRRLAATQSTGPGATRKAGATASPSTGLAQRPRACTGPMTLSTSCTARTPGRLGAGARRLSPAT